MDLGKKISQIRKEKKIKIDELVQLSGVPKGTLNKILTGITKDPQLETLKSIAKALDCTLDDFDETNIFDSFSYKEKEMVEQFRKLDEFGKKGIQAILDIELQRQKNELILSEQEKELIKQIRGFDESVRNDLLKYISDLYEDRDEIPNTENEIEEKAN